jgi:hypothetical protein
MNPDRRRFIAGGVVAAVAFATPRLAAEKPTKTPAAPAAKPPAERARPPRQDLDAVFEFVRVGHFNLARVKEMVAQTPRFVFASWDWGNGDWETALGGASHVGHRDIARFLLDHGARIDAFCAAMLGEHEVVLSLLAANLSAATAKGPHGYTLLYHAAISGDLAMAEKLKPLLAADAKDYTQALSAAVRDGHLEMTRWLFANGPVDPNVPDGLGKLPLVLAREKGFSEVADELRRHGARDSA